MESIKLAVCGVWAIFATLLPLGARAQPPGGDAEARAAIERAKAAYAAIRTYQDICVIVNEALAEGEEDPVRLEVRFTLKYAAPRSIVLSSDYGAVYCDGTTLWIVNPQSDEYTKSAAPDRIDLEVIGEDYPALQLLGHAAANFITRGERNPELLSKRLREVTSVVAEVRNGKAGKRVKGIGDHPPYEEVPITLWIDDRTGLVEEFSTDLTEAYQRMVAGMPVFAEEEDAEGFKPPKYTKMGYIVRLEDIRVNEEIPAGAFAFTPGEGMELVAEFSNPWENDGSRQQELVGKPAPDFGDEGLDGQPLKLSGLKGRVVLLDFWATWCGPCVQAIPHVQELSDRFKDKPVAVIGVNQDQGNTSVVKKFIEKKKITFRQFMDDGEVGKAYGVTGIPCSVLIDTEGVVQKISVGFMPGQEDELAEDIEALLAGRKLTEPEEAVAVEEQAGHEVEAAAAEGKAEKADTGGLTPLNVGALTAGKSAAGVFLNEQQVRRVDLDGDGKVELVCPDPQGGGLAIVSGDGQQVSRVKVKGKRGSFPSSFEAVRIGGETCWLIASHAASMSGLGRPSLGLYRPDGSEAWSFKPELPDKHSGQIMMAAGDLTGDDAPEFAVLVNAFRMERMGQMSFSQRGQAAHLVILDDQGRERIRRKVGGMGAFVHIAPAAEPDARPTILVSCDAKLLRFSADLSAAPAESKGAAPAAAADQGGPRKP